MNELPHVLIADSLWARLRWPKGARPHILVGAVAPDAYRVAAGMDYRALHFRSRHREGRRRRDFIERHLEPALASGDLGAQAFWVGWLSHIVADALWRRMIRAELPGLWSGCQEGRGAERTRLRHDYELACDSADRKLAALHRFVPELRWLMRGLRPRYDIGPLEGDALSEWVEVVAVSAMPPPETNQRASEVITCPFVTRAIEAAHEETLAVLTPLLQRFGPIGVVDESRVPGPL